MTPFSSTDGAAADSNLAARLTRSLRDPQLCHALLARLEQALDGRSLRFMEVCGTHTVSIFQSGLRSLLPAAVRHLSGPGCPVCVTHDAEVAAFLDLAGRDVIVATFGDLLRVPGPGGKSLKHAKAQGARVEIVYSPMDALTLAAANPRQTVVFLGIGFETTAPTVAATLSMAESRGLDNFTVFSLHKLVPPTLRALLDDPLQQEQPIEAFLLPGHVSTILGLAPYAFLADEYHVPAVVGGFEPADILLALCLMAEQRRDGRAAVVNAYPRAVDNTGNPRARALLEQYFQPADALWRGIGRIARSGLALRPARQEASGDAARQFCDGSGRAHMLLCDGMGVGKYAAVDGAMAANLADRLLRTGFEGDTTARLVNVALNLKSEEESGAALDLLSVDLYTGRVRLYKAGAAPSFTVQQGKVRAVEGAGLPVGILKEVSGKEHRFGMTGGDWVVLVSDGVLGEGDTWLRQQIELCAAVGNTPQEMADILADTARRRQSGTAPADDITVEVLKLERSL